MARALIIGCGAVATVAIKKCCTCSEVFSEICIASRHRENCEKLAQELRPNTKTVITTAAVDADKAENVSALIREYKPEIQAGPGDEYRSPLPGPRHHGCMP